MVGTLLTAPATWKLSTLQIVSAFGCASEKVRKSSLIKKDKNQHLVKVSSFTKFNVPYLTHWFLLFNEMLV
jgi:hypothetical protein